MEDSNLNPNNNNNNDNRVVQTYVVGEDDGRLQSIAKSFGLSQARQPAGRGGRASMLSILFDDMTLESARMHSVGTLGENERVDKGGTIHILTTRTLSRKQHRSVGDAPAAAGSIPQSDGEGYYSHQQAAPDYGSLMDLFQKPPTPETTKVIKESPATTILPGIPQEGPGPASQAQAPGGATDASDDDIVTVVVDEVEGGSLTAACFGIIKGTVGPAILYLPRGFKMAGYAIAIPCLMLSTASYLYCATRLLECWKVEYQHSHVLASKLEQVKPLLTPQMSSHKKKKQVSTQSTTSSFSEDDDEDDVTKYTSKVLSYPELGRRAFGSYGSFFIDMGIAVLQFGVCLTYLIFVPQNLYECVIVLSGGRVEVPKLYFLLLMLLIELPLSWIRDIRKLTRTNVMATFLTAYGLLSCLLIALFWNDNNEEEDDDIITAMNDSVISHNNTDSSFVDEQQEDWNLWERLIHLPLINDTWYLFIGTSFFVFEGGITLLVPLQDAVYKEEDKDKFPALNRNVTSIIVIFYVFFAMTCWAAFGERVRTALTASLPEGIYSTSVQLAYSIAVIFTFPLQSFPALEVAFSTMEKYYTSGGMLARNILSSVLIVLLGLIAVVAIDYLGNVVSLLGSLVGIPIALIFPPLMHNRLVVHNQYNNSGGGNNNNKQNLMFAKYMNYVVSGLGFFAMVAASFTTIVSWDKGAE